MWYKAKPISQGEPTSNVILEIINLVLAKIVYKYNLQEDYIDKYDPWMGIIATAVFLIHSIQHGLKCYNPGQLVFGHDMISPIKHTANQKLIFQWKQTQINYYTHHKNSFGVDCNYQFGDKVILINKSAHKY